MGMESRIGRFDIALHNTDIQAGVQDFLLDVSRIADTGVSGYLGHFRSKIIQYVRKETDAHSERGADPQALTDGAVRHTLFQTVKLVRHLPGVREQILSGLCDVQLP